MENEGNTFVTLRRIGDFPMPIDLLVTFRDGTQEIYYLPLSEMLGSKPVENQKIGRNELVAWPWVNPTYTLRINRRPEEIASLEIDPTLRMADVERANNRLDLPEAFQAFEDTTK